ncbi:uncharacterized protein LOC122423114 [Cervus canadensis]|uniref:uncharacterized protein LOC122423114 n=1 Tax=Cervus canadensis TaxID=1574408 RepID=UPI001CA360AE|nr:uncharacterized protein LOC122423114 [Cervus canadensis]
MAASGVRRRTIGGSSSLTQETGEREKKAGGVPRPLGFQKHCPKAFFYPSALLRAASGAQTPWLPYLDFLAALRRPHRPAPSRPRSSVLLRRRSQDPTLHQPARLHTRCACSCSRRLCQPPHPRLWAHPSPLPSQQPAAAATGGTIELLSKWRGQERVVLPGHVCEKRPPPNLCGPDFRSGGRTRPLAARPRPAQTPAVTEARRGDLTRQHGGGGRLGQRVGAAAAAARIAGSCVEHLPPPLSPLRVAGA